MITLNTIQFIPFIIALLMTLFIAALSGLLPLKLPLFYSLPWGDAQLVHNFQLLILPAVITLVSLLNLIISWQLHPSQGFFKKILQLSSLFISLILTITFIKIMLIFL